MEQFKICEKETKTKAYSKEGLAREEKLDPREIEKEKSRAWVQAIIERIDNFVESWEADIEKISSAKGKNKNKDQVLFFCSLFYL
jgi:CCR4-NOT transcription complex subunit 3